MKAKTSGFFFYDLQKIIFLTLRYTAREARVEFPLAAMARLFSMAR
jgi:hypothetical protein